MDVPPTESRLGPAEPERHAAAGAGQPQPRGRCVYRTGSREQRFPPEHATPFRHAAPGDPYTGGLSPLRAAFEQVALLSDYAAFKKAKFENHGVPDALVTPDEVIGEEERDRLETQWNQRFRRGGAGRVVVAESALKVQLLQQSMGDLAALAEMGATKELIANAFHCPIAFFTTQTSLANRMASPIPVIASSQLGAVSPAGSPGPR